LSEAEETHRPILHEGFFFAIVALFFFSLVSWFFATTPNLNTDISDFIKGFTLEQAPNSSIMLPAPAVPSAFTAVYVVAAQWCLIWGFFEVFLVVLRFGVRSSSGRKVETLTNLIWWFGAYYLISIFLNASTTILIWFVFWSAIIMLLGAQLVIRGLILAVMSRLK
jgi:hypothetical protein